MAKALRGPEAAKRRQRLKRVVSAQHGGERRGSFPTPPQRRSSFAGVITATVVSLFTSLFTFQMCDHIHERLRILSMPRNEEGCAGRALKLGGLSPRTASRLWPRDKNRQELQEVYHKTVDIPGGDGGGHDSQGLPSGKDSTYMHSRARASCEALKKDGGGLR
jgi:hypothetical protein